MSTLPPGFNRIKKLALIVGNNDYRQPVNKLDMCCRNANLLGKALKEMGFEIKKEENVENKSNMATHVNNWCEKIQDDNLLLFYFSGHGCQVKGENYLLLTDDDSQTEEDVNDQSIPFLHIAERISRTRKRCVAIFILDCCRSYQFKNGNNATGLKKIEPSENFFIQFSCAEEQKKTGNIFSECLLENIGIGMEIQLLFKKIYNDVREKSRGTQIPLSMYQPTLVKPIYLCEPVEDLPDIPLTAKWKRRADTTVGVLGVGPTLKRLYTPKGIWIRKNKAILVVDSVNHRILECGPGKNKRKVAGSRVSGYGFSQLFFPTDVIFDEASNTFLICDARNRRVSRWSYGRKICDEIIVDNIACYGIAIDRDGNSYISDTEKHEVRRYAPGDPYGEVVAGGNGRGSRLNQLNGPTYICMGPEKSLYISDSDNNRVVRWNENATEGVIVAGGDGKGRKLSQLDYPTGIVVDQNSTLYVADHWNNRIMRWYKDKRSGERIIGELLPGGSPTRINGPEGLRFDPKGNLYVVDGYNHRVQQFKIQ